MLSDLDTNKRPWALYCRVSTRDQHPEAQRKELEDYARMKGLPFVTLMEVQSSRKTRPVKEEILRGLRSGKYAGVVVWKLDRWGRSMDELVLEFNMFIEHHIKFVSLRDDINLDTAMGRFVAHVLSAFAAFERDLIRERTLLGLEEAERRGKRPGRPAGSKDKRPRRKSGYYLRYASEGKQTSDNSP